MNFPCVAKKTSGPIMDKTLNECIERLQLTRKDIKFLWKRFGKYDKDKSGTMDVNEFFKMIGESYTAFGNEVFELVDIDNNGSVDFSEFVLLSTKFCLLGKVDMLKFCFNVFDKDKSGIIEQDELVSLVQMMHGDDQRSNCKKALDEIAQDESNDGKLDFAAFVQMNENFPLLVYPAFRIQESLMLTSFGEHWWEKKREELSDPRSFDQKEEEIMRKRKAKRDAYKERRKLQIQMGLFKFYCCPHKRQAERLELSKKEAIRKVRKERREKAKKSIREKLLQETVESQKKILEQEVDPDFVLNKENFVDFEKRMENINDPNMIHVEIMKRQEARQQALQVY